MDFFEKVAAAPLDPILGLTVSFLADQRENKVNLGAGVYQTADLQPYILKSVKSAEEKILKTETSKDYLPIDGLKSYIQHTKQLVFGDIKNPERIYGAHTPGGTAAIRVAAEFLKETGLKKIYYSDPTWANHKRIFQNTGLQTAVYPYFNKQKKNLDFSAFMDFLEHLEEKSILLLQVCCHNPTGYDFSMQQWEEVCEKVQKKGLFPFFDLAYQGFGENLTDDVAPLIFFLNSGIQCVVAVSHSKNFGLYAERSGVLFFVCGNAEEASRVGSRIKMTIRGLYSNPPCHGARIVTEILQDATLRSLWENELEAMRGRISAMRNTLSLGLQSKVSSFDFLDLQRGMFSYTGLTEKQVESLIADYGIYLPLDGRINIAGLNTQNLEYVIDAIAAVTKN